MGFRSRFAFEFSTVESAILHDLASYSALFNPASLTSPSPLRTLLPLMADAKTTELMEKIVSLCKRKGLIFQSSEIYGGLNGFWDYGPLGAELKRHIKDAWWRSMTLLREDVVGLDASIIMHPKIWEASGHTNTFSELMVDCLLTKKRFRADQVEPQSGMVYSYTGAKDEAGGKESKDPFSVLLPAGKPPESARKTARQFYQQRGMENAALI